MKIHLFLLTIAFVLKTRAQATSSADLLSSLISEGFSVFNSFTSSAFGTVATSATSASVTSQSALGSIDPFSSLLSPTATTPSSTSSGIRTSTSRTATSSSSASSVSSSSRSITSQSTSSPSVINTSSSSQYNTAAAASSTSAATGSSGSNHDRLLAIVLGTVLGALALGLFILLLLILCRRRRRRRAATRDGSLTSISDDALATHKHEHAAGPLIAPVAATSSPPRRFRSLYGRSNAAVPLMSERSNMDVPSAHTFRNDNTTPFVPAATNETRLSGTTPVTNNSNVGSGLERPHHDGHHTGSKIAAGVGGAALGAAAARKHSRSSERRQQPRLSGDPGVHPAYWDEPPPRSPHRDSSESVSRRSGSMPRGTFYGPQDHASSQLRHSLPAATTGGLAGAAVGSATDSPRRRSYERGRGLRSNPPPYDDPRNGFHPSFPEQAPNGISAMPTGAAAGAGVMNHSRSRSRSHSQGGSRPPLPPALTIPNPNAHRNVPSRSPKRNRYSQGDAYHEPMPYAYDPTTANTVSPETARSNGRRSYPDPALSGVHRTDDLVSPISPEDMGRSFGHGRLSNGGIPRSRSISPNLPTRQPEPSLPIPPQPPAIHPSMPPRQNSGLVNAVQDHFDPSASTTHPIPHTQNSHLAYDGHTGPTSSQVPTFAADDSTATATARGHRPIARKPVPYSAYNSSAQPERSSSQGPWQGEEDSAWAQSYSGIGRAR